MLKIWRYISNMKPPVNTQLLHDVDIPTKKATFGMGCFWSNDSLFGVMPGVVRTRVGYSGGTTKNPHYRALGDHTEVIELDFDPKTITYDELLDIFWGNHEYGLTTKLKKQYQSLILYHDEEQHRAAEASYRETQERCKEPLRTEIAPAGTFYPAEELVSHDSLFNPSRDALKLSKPVIGSRIPSGKQSLPLLADDICEAIPNEWPVLLSYHQKYRLQGHKDLCHSLGLDSLKLQTSHLAARLNGYLVGVGGQSQFEQEVTRLGLTEKQADYVRRELERNAGGGLAC